MPSARSTQINLDATPYYHIIARCVRRSYLCGVDYETKRNYSHRRNWIISRLKFLAQVFSIKICAYAIMENHYHTVLFVDDIVASKWSKEEVISRWATIFPKDAQKHSHIPAKIELWRERLTSISWFMRCLNEPIARAANDEDDCTGRFWEGRFKSQALLDKGALLSAMAYVDLNPIRAGIAKTPEGSEFTSIYERIQFMGKQLEQQKGTSKKYTVRQCDLLSQPAALVPFSNSLSAEKEETVQIRFNLSDYLELIEHTGQVVRNDKVGSISEHLPPILDRLNFNLSGWLSMVKDIEHKFYYAIGSETHLVDFSKNRKRVSKGLAAAKTAYLA